jgi:hypothetical protein
MFDLFFIFQGHQHEDETGKHHHIEKETKRKEKDGEYIEEKAARKGNDPGKEVRKDAEIKEMRDVVFEQGFKGCLFGDDPVPDKCFL